MQDSQKIILLWDIYISCILKTGKIFIRADSSVDMGIGHMMRCLSLAEILVKTDFEVIFISNKLNAKIYNLIIKKRCKF